MRKVLVRYPVEIAFNFSFAPRIAARILHLLAYTILHVARVVGFDMPHVLKSSVMRDVRVDHIAKPTV